MTSPEYDDDDIAHLRRCIELAVQATRSGNEPFGSILVDSDGRVCFEDHNRTAGGDATRHPEFEIARWAADNLSPAERAASTVYTSGEHCPMCSAAHAWVGLGRIVYAAGAAQYAEWMAEIGAEPSPVAALSIREVAPAVPVAGPVPELAEEMRRIQQNFHRGRRDQ